jgi:NAD(P)-dependent dehydrogenase (short-subunit alcohol dehydrogenase family)
MPDREQPLRGQVAVVTGASSGIGLETARGLARLGAELALVCRSRPRGEAAVASIVAERPAAVPELFIADLASMRAVRELSERLHARYDAVHALVNNAGIVSKRYERSVDGVELQFATNYLATYQLTALLLDLLVAGVPARVVNVASGIHGRASFDTDDLASPAEYNPFKAYARSKLAVVAFTHDLAQRLVGSGVTVNCVEPGLTRTHLLDYADVGMFRLVRRLLLFAPTAEQSAVHCVRLAAAPELAGTTGTYFRKSKPGRPAPAAKDPRVLAALRALSERLTGVQAGQQLPIYPKD